MQHVWLKGELSNFKHHSSGHMYFTLKDERACLKGIMFRGKNICLRFKPENGMKVIVYGAIGVYEKNGQYQLYVEEMIPDGLGALHVAFEQLKGKLEQEGLFDAAQKKALPAFPQRIGMITSPTGAAIHDMLTVIERRYCGVEVVLYPVHVQGREAPGEIAQGIDEMNRLGDIDVLIIGRGGGSLEELWAFNEEIVARKIFASRIPVVSAVGHETDYTIADFVADMRAPTPSAAAEMVVPEKIQLLQYLSSYYENLTSKMKLRLEIMINEVEHHKERLKKLGPAHKIEQQVVCLAELKDKMNQQISIHIEKDKLHLKHLQEKLEILNPRSILMRGYSICCRYDNGEVIIDEEQVKQGDVLEIIFHQGNKVVRVEK